MVEFFIRKALADDAEAVAELAGQLGYSVTPEEARERLSSLESSQADAVLVSAVKDRSGVGKEQVIGWTHVMGAHRILAEPFAELSGLVVSESYRREGVGRGLLEGAKSWARERGYRRLVVRSNVVRKEAHPFYRSLGYELKKTQHIYEIATDSK